MSSAALLRTIASGAAWKSRKPPRSCGFTLLWSISPRQLPASTETTRRMRKAVGTGGGAASNLHHPILSQGMAVQVVAGTSPTTGPDLPLALGVPALCRPSLRRTLRRRSQRGGFTWERMDEVVLIGFPRRASPPWPDEACVRTGVGRILSRAIRICAGGARWPSLPRYASARSLSLAFACRGCTRSSRFRK